MEPIIKAKNLNFTYNKGRDNEFQALIDISLEIYPEEYVIFFGPSGCGKSTLLNVISGLEKPDSGEVTAMGRNLMTMTKDEFAMYHRNEVGMIYQAYNLITSLTVLDNVALPQIFVNVKKRKREKWGMQLLERFGILKHAHKIPTELSGGQQQRIGIARAIVNNPKIILADEAMGNLDSVSAKNVIDILDDLNKKEKKTIIMVTHNPEILYVADRIIYMKDGVITKEVVNKDRYKKNDTTVVPRSPLKEIDDLMRTYQGLDPAQINVLIMPYKAKMFASHFTTHLTMEEVNKFEDVIQRRLLGTISEGELYDVLDRPSSEGGVGFDKRSAGKLVRRINRVMRVSNLVYQEHRQAKNENGVHERVTIESKVEKVLYYILRTCYNKYYKHLDEVQVNRIRQAIRERISAKIVKSDFQNFLDMSFGEGGVGLNSKTAKHFTEELELIMVLGYGTKSRADLANKKKDYHSDKKDTSSKVISRAKEDLSSLLGNLKVRKDMKQNIIKNIPSINKIDNEKEDGKNNKNQIQDITPDFINKIDEK